MVFLTIGVSLLAVLYLIKPWSSKNYFEKEKEKFLLSKSRLGEIEEEQVLESLIELEADKKGGRLDESDYLKLKKEIISRHALKNSSKDKDESN